MSGAGTAGSSIVLVWLRVYVYTLGLVDGFIRVSVVVVMTLRVIYDGNISLQLMCVCPHRRPLIGFLCGGLMSATHWLTLHSWQPSATASYCGY